MMTPPEKIRILCVDDHEFLIEGLAARFADEPDLEIVGRLGSADGLLVHADETGAHIALLDIDLPGRDVFGAIAELRSREIPTRAVLLSGYVRQTYLDLALTAGAWGYLAKRDSPDTIIDAIRKVHGGEFAFSPAVLETCGLDPHQAMNAEGERVTSRLSRLTNREMQILRMIGQGLSRNQIADTLHRSPKTIDAHRSAIMDKLNLHDRVDLARFAIREGLVEV